MTNELTAAAEKRNLRTQQVRASQTHTGWMIYTPCEQHYTTIREDRLNAMTAEQVEQFVHLFSLQVVEEMYS